MAANLLFLGPPGCGKGTQARILMQRHRLVQLSTGEILREAGRAGDRFGDRVRAIMDSGQLVPDDIMIGIIQARLRQPDAANGFILDGFPRTLAQAEALQTMLGETGQALRAVIAFDVDGDVLVERISGRFTCADCGAGYHDRLNPPRRHGVCDQCGSGTFNRRTDDRAENVQARLDVYRRQTAPLLPYYEKLGILRHVDGMAGVETVTASIEAIMGPAA